MVELDRRLAKLFDEEYFERLKAAINKGDATQEALFFLGHYFGKPIDRTEHSGSVEKRQTVHFTYGPVPADATGMAADLARALRRNTVTNGKPH